ncbi:MAG: hypothetical protein LOX97_05640 [Sphingomonas sp.]|nr:hypothetical protein [Sphingomonas sp.]
MDIIAAHQQGLVEQIEEDARTLAGRPGDYGQRAIVLHHMYSNSSFSHEWALAEALREMRIARAIDRLHKSPEGWGWSSRRRGEARAALAGLARAIGEASRARCASAFAAYRLTGTASLRGEAERLLGDVLRTSLCLCHAARRSAQTLPDETRLLLWQSSEELATASVDQDSLDAAWTRIGSTRLARKAWKLLGGPAMERARARDASRGWAKGEAALRADPLLPAAFRANPAQHFYSLQHLVAERRRKQWREACDRDAGAFELAA